MLIAEALIIITEIRTSEVTAEHHSLLSAVMIFSSDDLLSTLSDSSSSLSELSSNAVSVKQISTELSSQYESLRDVFRLTEQV